jgi:hypothetical protein
MPRINPQTLATKALAICDEMPEELHQLEDAITAAKRARDKWLVEHPAIRWRLQRVRDSAPIDQSRRILSIFADESRDPKPAA